MPKLSWPWKSRIEISLTATLVIATISQGVILHRANIDNRASSVIADKAATAAQNNSETAASLLIVQKRQLDENQKLVKSNKELTNITKSLQELQQKQITALYRPILTTDLAMGDSSPFNPNIKLYLTVSNVGDNVAFQPTLYYIQEGNSLGQALSEDKPIDGPEEILPNNKYAFSVDYQVAHYSGYKDGLFIGRLQGHLFYKNAAEDQKIMAFCYDFTSNTSNYRSIPSGIKKC